MTFVEHFAWDNKPLESLSKEELIAVVQYLFKAQQSAFYSVQGHLSYGAVAVT